MTNDIHSDSDAMLREILAKTLEIGDDTVSIKRALWPDGEGQPGVLTEHNKRITDLERWRSYLAGAWFVTASFFAKHLFGKQL